MKPSLSFSLTLFVILACFTCSILTSECGPGYYKQFSFIPCHQCEPGKFCPGDDKSHDCAHGSVSGIFGASSCYVCPSKRSNGHRTACLLEDTPEDASEIVDGHVFEVHAAKINNVYMSLDPQVSENDIAQVSFIGKNQFDGVTVYASLRSGYPTPANSVSQSSGLNATVSFSRDIHNFTIVYFSLFSNSKASLTILPKLFTHFTTEYSLKDNSLSLSNLNFDQTINLIQFKKDFIPKNTPVNVKFQLTGINYSYPYQLLYSTNPSLYQLNPNNANYQIQAKRNQLVQFTVKQSRDGPFVFALFDGTTLFNVNINITLNY
ncbi:predicted protein [Naegleria gruberi]|uniref:Predicted protein n=1 Tax=Naegleria gruberi TaxID=5762 RepID=D2VS43_NAEGR|nr:uncharacterized protein NAEGRDRAFT_71806 [Naegleria gruberi]EFC40360.1 predicted protein [Naegleria gruberi]|eukprot:XP_002673104.1 predicted protein [Naegleria gruberi strain NEG-M]